MRENLMYRFAVFFVRVYTRMMLKFDAHWHGDLPRIVVPLTLVGMLALLYDFECNFMACESKTLNFLSSVFSVFSCSRNFDASSNRWHFPDDSTWCKPMMTEFLNRS